MRLEHHPREATATLMAAVISSGISTNITATQKLVGDLGVRTGARNLPERVLTAQAFLFSSNYDEWSPIRSPGSSRPYSHSRR
jgi:hypothetical protein